jgi:hypothetical protein
MTNLVCFDAFREADRDLEMAWLRYRVASHALATVRERLEQAVDLAYQEQSFSPIGTLFDKEDAVRAVYERAAAKVAKAEERWFALSAALAYEKNMMLMGPLSHTCLH